MISKAPGLFITVESAVVAKALKGVELESQLDSMCLCVTYTISVLDLVLPRLKHLLSADLAISYARP